MTAWRHVRCIGLGSFSSSRRSVLTAAVLTLVSRGTQSIAAFPDPQGKPEAVLAEKEEIAAAEKVARDGKLGPLRHSTSEHFLAIGDSGDKHRTEALKLSESMGQSFLAHFRALGFKVAYPDRRLVIVTLNGPASYSLFLGREPDKDEGGSYDVETRRLVIFDLRAQPGDIEAPATRANLFALVHETAHQLSFNTGLLNAENDVPLCISEGFATYVELWRPGVKNSIGGINKPRLEALIQSADKDNSWIPLTDLLADDKAFSNPKTAQLAYAESWLLVHHLLKTRSRLPGLRDYLAATPATSKQLGRIKVAEKHLGSLTKLDREIKNEARRYVHE
jgi:Protein of unknown function (DUF1570)